MTTLHTTARIVRLALKATRTALTAAALCAAAEVACGDDEIMRLAPLAIEEPAPAAQVQLASTAAFDLATFLAQPQAAPLPSVEEEVEAATANPMAATVTPGGEQTYGEEQPPPIATRQFLRTQSVLLAPGDWQFDYGLIYSIQQFDFPLLEVDPNGPGPGDDVIFATQADFQRRVLFVPFAFRYGWSDRVQLYANVPVGYRNTEVATSPVTDPTPRDDFDSTAGFGDIDIGFNYLWAQGDGYCYPDIVFSFGATLPTSEAFLSGSSFAGGLGNGVWAVNAQFLVIHTYDPVAVYWGAGYNYQFEREFDGVPIRLGQQISYQLGAGFALNDRVTLSSTFIGLWVSETEIFGRGVPGTQAEPLRLRFAVTAMRNCRIVEPFAEIGMTDEAPRARVGVVWTY